MKEMCERSKVQQSKVVVPMMPLAEPYKDAALWLLAHQWVDGCWLRPAETVRAGELNYGRQKELDDKYSVCKFLGVFYRHMCWFRGHSN